MTTAHPTPPDALDLQDASPWMLDPSWVFLNAGSFGLRLRSVMEARQALLDDLERQPVDFLERRAPGLIQGAREALGAWLGADPDGLVFVSNATEAIDAVLASVSLGPGDVILIGDQAYGAVAQAAAWTAQRTGCGVETVEVSMPVQDASEVAAAWSAALERLGDTVTLAIVDHVVSPTALVQPIEAIVRACRAEGVQVLVDGAHAPGMLDLDIEAIGADWYAGNLHKWVGAPSGAGFLWSAPSLRALTRPVIPSHFVFEGYHQAFDWTGTRDITPWLCVPAAIEAVESAFGWSRLRAWQQAMCTWSAAVLSEALGEPAAGPPDGSMWGSMCAVRVPGSTVGRYADRFAFRDEIATRFKVECAISDVGPDWWLRLSFGPWVTTGDIDRAVDAVRDCL